MPHFDFMQVAVLAQEAPGVFEQIIRSPILPIVVIGILLYFMMLRPEKVQREKLRAQQASLSKNDRVVIAGGIYGIVVDAPKGGERIKVKVDENNNTTLRVLRSSVVQVLGDESTSSSSASSDAADSSEKK